LNSQKVKRIKAIEKLGGVKCPGLSFIDGPDCPVHPELLTVDDMNFSHRKSSIRKSWKKSEDQILGMKRPEKVFILLCCMCNERMRHLAKEFGFIKLPKRVISLYLDKNWSLERIANEYGCIYGTVSGFLKRNGVEIRKGSKMGGMYTWGNPAVKEKLLRERRTRWFTPERIKTAEEMLEMYDGGDSLRDVAQWFGTTHHSVRAHLKLIGEL